MPSGAHDADYKVDRRDKTACRCAVYNCVVIILHDPDQEGWGLDEFVLQRIPGKVGIGTDIHLAQDAGPVSAHGSGTQRKLLSNF